MSQLIPIIPLLPLLGFIIIGLFGNKLNKTLAGGIASATVLGAFVASLALFFNIHQNHKAFEYIAFTWIKAGGFQADMGFLIDELSVWMMLVITGIGFLIHIYSTGYMAHDPGFSRFFAYLNLFIFSMLLLVMGNNFLILFIGWEGVGLCSYLLIGFWYKNNEYGKAARKAFIMNRIGDLGLLLGIFLIFTTIGTVNYANLNTLVATATPTTLTVIAILLFVGAMGKSAQIPLYTWLPDAMAGPTPVSALIHAATMVTAGIYMVVRTNVIYTASPFALAFVALIGLATSLFAAIIGLRQNDIKKVLAYSTVSQLGLMFLALGAGAYASAMFHLTTHAFFKALLFLGAGSVIHAMSGEQDIRNMGGLKDKLPQTFRIFLIGTLAIIGFPLLSGFFSKDEILANVFAYSPVLWFFGLVSSVITAFYMLRLLFLTFYGNFRGTEQQAHHLHESPASMTIPLWILAGLSVIGGLLNLPHFIFHESGSWLAHWYQSVIPPLTTNLSASTEWLLMLFTTALILAVLYLNYQWYVQKGSLAKSNDQLKGWEKWAANKFYIDELYDLIFVKPITLLSHFFSRIIDNSIIDGFVNGVGRATLSISDGLRRLQTGNIEFYFFGIVLGIIAIITFSLIL
ncbi:MAG: NADH-quinone oxidoreductase subunit L [Sphingobacteriales bacterium]|jgi:NADH-quinone oxidoreductase subunit L|nr:NADH-quinone oxidoreductase subunit L [Sphingobacteriales bacterium]MBP9141930.1 NADH-quinone oxidoreductase subunit L [Chitinophagales bacterium]MDA0199176.1 NADH-quinone oxidoreductase subunit L [Bacteroidota bacterium]MBK7528178.1 NADH-quinone oxidoreductase subunit L [Sphingobacteriales bacterium]MBL0246095.1 NADH-quinone oxidoreductase subunit L [Sphingobacteriales bacterium]